MSPKKSFSQREKELQELAARYQETTGRLRATGTSPLNPCPRASERPDRELTIIHRSLSKGRYAMKSHDELELYHEH
jgi:hypothetical protein